MHHTKTHFFFRFVLICTFVTYFENIHADIECNVLFPMHYKSQGIKVYQAGEIIHTKIDDTIISFFIKDHTKDRNLYFLVIRPSDITYKFKNAIDKAKQQTIECMTIAPDCAYKFYKVSITKNQDWTVCQEYLDDGIIPDTTVVIFYNPLYIDTLTLSDNHIPTFLLVDNLLQIAHGKDLLFTEEVRYLFDTLNMDPLHRRPSYLVVAGNSKCKRVMHT